jgi:hypothetical protein
MAPSGEQGHVHSGMQGTGRGAYVRTFMWGSLNGALRW